MKTLQGLLNSTFGEECKNSKGERTSRVGYDIITTNVPSATAFQVLHRSKCDVVPSATVPSPTHPFKPVFHEAIYALRALFHSAFFALRPLFHKAIYALRALFADFLLILADFPLTVLKYIFCTFSQKSVFIFGISMVELVCMRSFSQIYR